MLTKTINGIKYWGQLFLLPIYWLSFLFPRKKNIWLFGSTFGKRFADNPRYFFLYCNQHKDDICIGKRHKQVRPIWISHNKDIVKFVKEKGYEAYYYHSFKGIWFCLIAGVYLFDNYSKDISFWLSGGAIKINMWHGVGNKCINYDNKHDKVRHPKNLWEKIKFFPRRLSDEKPDHYILTTSQTISKIFSKAFRIPMSHVIEAGYPRNDVLFEECCFSNIYTAEEEKLINKLSDEKEKGKTILGYVPTFRKSESKFKEVMNISEFNNFLAENNMILVCKLHPKSTCREEFYNMDYSNIYHVMADADVNSFLNKIDILIGDYSSVYSDYILLERPVVAFHYDFKEYMSDTREGYFDFKEYMPEVRAYNMDELKAAILDVMDREIPKERKDTLGNMFKYVDSEASNRLSKEVLRLLD